MNINQEIAELRAMVEALEAKYETMRLATLEWGKDVENLQRWSDQHLLRIERLEADATCPHIVSSDEGTSYCDLALQTAAAQSKPQGPTDEELDTIWFASGSGVDGREWRTFARDVLARWGRPVAELGAT
jgi:hypothetical protein